MTVEVEDNMEEHKEFLFHLKLKDADIRSRISAYKREFLSESMNKNQGSRGQKIARPKPSAAESMKNKLRG